MGGIFGGSYWRRYLRPSNAQRDGRRCHGPIIVQYAVDRLRVGHNKCPYSRAVLFSSSRPFSSPLHWADFAARTGSLQAAATLVLVSGDSAGSRPGRPLHAFWMAAGRGEPAHPSTRKRTGSVGTCCPRCGRLHDIRGTATDESSAAPLLAVAQPNGGFECKVRLTRS